MSDARLDRADLRPYLRLTWRHKWPLLAIVVAIPAAVYLVSSQVSKVWEARTTVFVQSTTINAPEISNPISVSTSSPADVARLIQTPVVAEIAAERLDIPRLDSRSLLEAVKIELEETPGDAPGDESDFLTIFARDEDPKRAADIAAAFAGAVAQKRTRDAVRAIDQTIRGLSAEAEVVSSLSPTGKAQLEEQLQALRGLRETQAGSTQVVDPAILPESPISPRPLRNAILGVILALILAAGLLPVLDRLDAKIRRPDELEELGAAPMLAMIPTAAFPGQQPRHQVREAFQTLRAGLTSFHLDRTLATIAVTSPGHGEGKTTVATNLAVALAQNGSNTILVDGDLRRGDAAERLGLRPRAGLDAVLIGERTVQETLVTVSEVQGHLRVMPAGPPPPNPSVLLGSARMRSVLAELAELADIVIVDTPPALVVSDALPLFEHLSGTVVVARVDYTTREALAKTVKVIETASGRILGGVATGTRAGGMYGYGVYVEGYEAEPESDDELDPFPDPTNGQGSGPLSRLRNRTAGGRSDPPERG